MCVCVCVCARLIQFAHFLYFPTKHASSSSIPLSPGEAVHKKSAFFLAKFCVADLFSAPCFTLAGGQVFDVVIFLPVYCLLFVFAFIWRKGGVAGVGG